METAVSDGTTLGRGVGAPGPAMGSGWLKAAAGTPSDHAAPAVPPAPRPLQCGGVGVGVRINSAVLDL